MRDAIILFANVALVALVWYLRRRAGKEPRALWVFLLYGLRIGPRTDTQFMTRHELIESGARFVIWALFFSSAFWAIGIIGRLLFPSGELPSALLLLWLATALFAGMGVVGGTYLLVRGALRGPNYSPPGNPPSGEA